MKKIFSKPFTRSKPLAVAVALLVSAQAAVAAENNEAVLGTVKVNEKADVSTEHSGSYTTPKISIGKSVQSIKETPHSVSVITRQRLDDQNITSVPEALKYTTGVNVQRFDGAGFFNNYYVRGYQVDSILLDGVPFGNTGNVTEIDTAMYDRIEVLKGPAGLFQGAGEPSAAINLARKRAQQETQLKGTVALGSWDAYRFEIDGAAALNSDGSLRGRMVGVSDERDSYLDVVNSSKHMLYGTLEYDLNSATTVSIGATRQEIDAVIDQGLPAYSNGQLLNVSRSTFIGADWNKQETNFTDLFAEFEHRLSGGGQLKVAARHVDRYMLYRVARANGAVIAQGTTALQLGEFSPDRDGTSIDAFADLPFEAFGQTHNLVSGYGWRTQDEISDSSVFNSFGASPMSVFTPNHAIAQPAFPVISRTETETEQSGFYSQLRIKVLDDLSVIVGGRLSNWETKVKNKLSGETTSRGDVDNEFTPYGALIFDANDHVSIYASYADIFVPQTAQDINYKQLDPRIGKQYEIGAKGEFFDGLMNMQAAAFHLQDKNRGYAITLSGPVLQGQNPSPQAASGEVRSEGWEFEVSGQLAPGWDLTFGYTRVETEYLEGTSAQNGQDFASFTPKHSANLWTHYSFSGSALQGLSIGGGARYLSSFYSQALALPVQPKFEADAYTVVAAQVGYQFSEHWSANLTVDNLLDEKYYEKVSGAGRQNFYGAPRSLMLAIKASLF